jgi:adenosylhomocysteine nucleosidase
MSVTKYLVITPMREERAHFASRCSEFGYRSRETTAGLLPILEFPELNLILAEGGTGKVQFAVQTQHLLESDMGPDLVICAGAAGSLAEDIHVGDLVIGAVTVEHDIREGFIDAPLPRFEADPDLIASFSRVPKNKYSYSVHIGTVASGDEDIVSSERKRSLNEATGAIAAAWEGAGGAKASRFSGVPFVEIRAITDAADEGAASDFRQNLATAMGNIAEFLIAWILMDPEF